MKTSVLRHLHIFVMAKNGFRTIPLLSKGLLLQHSSVCTKLPGHNSPYCFVLQDLYLSAQQHTIVLPSNHALCLLPQRHTKPGVLNIQSQPRMAVQRTTSRQGCF